MFSNSYFDINSRVTCIRVFVHMFLSGPEASTANTSDWAGITAYRTAIFHDVENFAFDAFSNR